jgi:hypothetical protein
VLTGVIVILVALVVVIVRNALPPPQPIQQGITDIVTR